VDDPMQITEFENPDVVSKTETEENISKINGTARHVNDVNAIYSVPYSEVKENECIATPLNSHKTEGEFLTNLTPFTKIPKVVRSINHLPESIYSRDSAVNPVEICGEVSALLKGMTSTQLQSVIKKIDPKNKDMLEKILVDSKLILKEVGRNDTAEKTNNVKKNILNRYRRESGICFELPSIVSGGGDVAERISGLPPFQMPEMDVSAEQREAASKALAKWLEQKKANMSEKDICTEETEDKSSKETTPVNKAKEPYREKTVIKATPLGLRKLTFFEGEFQQ